MDINNDISEKGCFKCDKQVIGSLNIDGNASNSLTILWNKYQIFIYEELKFNSTTRTIEPEFQIQDLLLFNNHIVCLDCGGNIHIISLKIKNPTQKRLKTSFQPRKQNVLAIAKHNTDCLLTLQCSNDILCMDLHQINRDFHLDQKYILFFDKEQPICNRKEQICIFKCHTLAESNYNSIKQLFNMENNLMAQSNIIVLSLDRRSIYACIIYPTMAHDEIQLVNLYLCPSEICDIQITEDNDLKIVLGLTVGTVIVIPVNDTDRKPVIIHLNTAIYKFLVSKNTMLHTDGCTMWKTENIYSKEINFHKLFVKQVKDFIQINNKIICTTFTNLIYVFRNDENACAYLQNANDYSPAEKLINNSECLNEIMCQIKKNEELVKKLSKEENYITALSLSNRQDIMNDVIHTKVIVHESYEDAIKEYGPITLTEEIEEYFKPESSFFLINILVNTLHSIFNNILSNLFTDMKIHITFSDENKLLKTTSIKLKEQLKIVNYLIPLKTASTRINTNIAFVTNIPGAYDEKQISWTVLYRKHVLLNSQHFIKTNNVNDQILCLKKPLIAKEELLQVTLSVYRDLFKFTDISKLTTQENQWSMYVKLPKNYPEVLKNSNYCKQHLNSKTYSILSQQYTSEDFLKSKNNFIVIVDDVKVKVEVVNDGFSNPVLRISSGNLKITLDIRNLFAELIYNEGSYTPNEEFISHTFYTTVENIQKAVRTCITKGSEVEEFISLSERFERNIIGALPL